MPPIADVAESVKPWVASISVETVFRGVFTDFTDEGAGSGIVVRPNGYVVTNAHVIAGARDIKVHVDGQTYDGQVVGVDDVTDLALVKINAEDLPAARFASEDKIRVGEWVVSLGNALALKGGPTVTIGIISALGRTIQSETGEHFYNLIQTDAAMNDGSSGGPLVNLEGEVVGINQSILRQAEGMAFAINGADALPVIRSLLEHGRVIRPLIGFNGDDVTPAISARFQLGVLDGVLVTALTPRGPAHEAGIQLGGRRYQDGRHPNARRFDVARPSMEVRRGRRGQPGVRQERPRRHDDHHADRALVAGSSRLLCVATPGQAKSPR